MTAELGTKAVRGAAWLGSGQMIRMAVSMLTSIILARQLPPSDFGLFGMTYIAAELAQLFTAFGFGSALIQQQTTDRAVLTSCFWTNVLIASAIAAALILGAPAIALYFQRTEITFLVIPLALTLVISAAMVVPQALLTQRLQFKELTISQTIGSAAAAIVTVSAASAGLGVWSLALQPFTGNLVTFIVMIIQARWFPHGRPSFKSVRPLMQFSTHLLLGSLVDWVSRNLPIMIIGRVLGAAALGFYGMATGLTGAVIFQISSVIVRVLFPTLSAMQGERDRIGRVWVKACSAIAMLAWPLMAGAIALAADLIPLVFGATWVPSVVPFQVLCALMAVQAVATTAGSVLMAFGRTGLMLRVSIISTIASAAALYGGSFQGLNGVAAAYAVVGIATQLVWLWCAAQAAEIRLVTVLEELGPLALASVVMGVLLGLVHTALGGLTPGQRLLACIAFGLLLYPACLWLLARQRTTALVVDVLARLRNK